MIIPDDPTIAFRNILGSFVILGVCFFCAHALFLLGLTSLLHIILACCCLFLLCISAIGQFAPVTSDNITYQALSRKGMMYVSAAFILGIFALVAVTSSSELTAQSGLATSLQAAPVASVYTGPSSACLNSLSAGFWVTSDCSNQITDPHASAGTTTAFCEKAEWTWAPPQSDMHSANTCPVARLTSSHTQSMFRNKRVVFLGDSVVRLVYHSFNTMLTPSYKSDNLTSMGIVAQEAAGAFTLKHTDMEYVHAALNATVEFYWAPFVQNLTSYMNKPSLGLFKDADLIVCGATLWNALYFHNVDSYSKATSSLAATISKNKVIKMNGTAWLAYSFF
jgi:hypothetical protein